MTFVRRCGQKAKIIRGPWPTPPPSGGPARITEEYLAGNDFVRLNLWLQHRDMRKVLSRFNGQDDSEETLVLKF